MLLVPKDNQVEVNKIELIDMAQTWWIAEEEWLEKSVAWEKLTERFYERFFPKTARREMEQQFINQRQGSRTVDEYVAEFLKLSQFAPYMVADEEDQASQF